MSEFDYFGGNGQSLMSSPDASMLNDSNGFSSFMNSAATGFGTGLNPIGGLFGVIGAGLEDQATEDELNADEAQINLSQKQNTTSYLQKISGNNSKLATVLAGTRAAAAAHGISMDSGSFAETLTRNLSAYDQDNLSDYANYSYTKQNLEEKRAADQQKANDQKDSSLFGAITSFF